MVEVDSERNPNSIFHGVSTLSIWINNERDCIIMFQFHLQWHMHVSAPLCSIPGTSSQMQWKEELWHGCWIWWQWCRIQWLERELETSKVPILHRYHCTLHTSDWRSTQQGHTQAYTYCTADLPYCMAHKSGLIAPSEYGWMEENSNQKVSTKITHLESTGIN